MDSEPTNIYYLDEDRRYRLYGSQRRANIDHLEKKGKNRQTKDDCNGDCTGQKKGEKENREILDFQKFSRSRGFR
jgi:hypothetical protein